MRITRPDEKNVCVSQLNALVSELLRRVPQSADPGDNAAARARLFSPPTHNPDEAELIEDWRTYIEPELAQVFLSALEVVEGDLQGLHIDPMTGQGTISIPVSHLASWIHGLNQARITLAARHEITEEEMESELPLSGGARTFALLQIYIYAKLLHLFLDELEGV